MHHRKIYEQHHQGSLLPGIEVHHIDGDPANNDPKNLLAVTIEEHLAIHKAQQDWGAVQAILMRMETPSELIADAARKKQLELIAAGQHNFQKIPKERKKEIGRKAGLKTKELGLGVHRLNQDPVAAKANASRAGQMSQLKRKDPAYAYLNKLQGEAVKNTKWYYNTITNEKIRMSTMPEGPGWIQGMGPVNNIDTHWWHNTITGQRMRTTKQPEGQGWKKGMKNDRSE